MAAPDTLNSVTARKLSSVITSLWAKIKLLVTGSIQALDVSSVGGSGKYISAISETDGKISATATTMDTTPTANSTNAVTSGGIKTALGNYVPFSYKILDTNPFGGKHLYLNYIGNAMYSMDKRYFVTATFHERVVDGVEYPRIKPGASVTDDVYYEDSPVVSTVISSTLRTLFNGYYDSGITIASGKYLKIHIQFSDEENWTPATGRVSDYEYNYGDYFLSFYYSKVPSGAKWRCYNTYAQHTVGWKQGDFSYYAGNASSAYSVILTARDAGNHERTCIEFVVFPKDSVNANLTQIDWCLDRPTLSKTFPFFTNFADQNSYVDWYFKQKVNETATIEIKGSDGSIKAKSLTLTTTPLAVSSGGTGQTTAQNVVRETIQSGIVDKATATTDVSDTTEIITTHATSGYTSSTKDLYRRPATKLWNYIKDKISSVLGLSTTGYTGNAATATNAGSGGDLADAVSKKHSHSSLTLSKTAQTYDGTHTLALPSSDPYTSARTPTAHTHNTDAADVTDSPGSTPITDSTEFVTTNINGYGDGDKKLYRRNFGSYIWPWIRSKLSSDTSVVVSGTAKEVGGTMVLEDSSDTRIGLISVTTLGETTAVKYECLITVEATAGMGNNGSGIVLLAKGNARGTTAYNHSLSILNINKWNVRDYRPMIWNVSSGNGIVTMFGIWDASNNQLAPFTYSRVTVTKLTASEQNVNWLFTHDNGSWSESSTYLTTFASGAAIELVDYSTSNINWRIRCGWDGPAISKVYPTPIQSTLQQSAYLLSLHTEGYTAFYKEVRAANVTVGNSLKWNGYDLVIGQAPTTPADNTIYIF